MSWTNWRKLASGVEDRSGLLTNLPHLENNRLRSKFKGPVAKGTPDFIRCSDNKNAGLIIYCEMFP